MAAKTCTVNLAARQFGSVSSRVDVITNKLPLAHDMKRAFSLGNISHIFYFNSSHSIRNRRLKSVLVSNASEEGGLGGWFKKARDSLPIVGLVSKITDTDGQSGFQDQTFPEYTRGLYDTAPAELGPAVADLRKLHPRTVNDRTVTYCLWVVNMGAGLILDDKLSKYATRGVMNMDFEYEAFRFESDRAEVIKAIQQRKIKYEVPESKGKQQVAKDVLLAAFCGAEPTEEEAALVSIIATSAFLNEV